MVPETRSGRRVAARDSGVNEHPAFVPFDTEHLATLVTIPDEAPSGLVLLLQGGGGAPRSHRYRLWTRMARELARFGIASVRLDYVGIGDSTGSLELAMRNPPVDQAMAVVRYWTDLLGTNKVGVVGNCIGARAAFMLAARMPDCEAVACILPISLGPILREQPAALRAGSSSAWSNRPPRSVVGHTVRRLRRASGHVPPAILIPDVAAAASKADLLFLHGGTEASRQRLSRAVEALPHRREGHSVILPEVDFLPTNGTSGFRPLEMQGEVVRRIGAWMGKRFPAPVPV